MREELDSITTDEMQALDRAAADCTRSNGADFPLLASLFEKVNRLAALAPSMQQGVMADQRNFRPVAGEHQCVGGLNVLSYIKDDARVENVQRVRPLLYSGTVMAARATSAPGVDDAMVRRALHAPFRDGFVSDCLVAGTDWDFECMQAALEAALTQPTEGSGPSVAGGE